MATRYERHTIRANESFTSDITVGPQERLVAVIPLGDWPDIDFGIDILPHLDDEGWHPVHDGMAGGRARVKVVDGGYSVIADFNHPISNITDDKVRLVVLSTGTNDEVAAPEAREVLVCLARR